MKKAGFVIPLDGGVNSRKTISFKIKIEPAVFRQAWFLIGNFPTKKPYLCTSF